MTIEVDRDLHAELKAIAARRPDNPGNCGVLPGEIRQEDLLGVHSIYKLPGAVNPEVGEGAGDIVAGRKLIVLQGSENKSDLILV